MGAKTTHQLLADVGGTNTRIAWAIDGVVDHDRIRKYTNAEFASLEAVIKAAIAETGICPDSAALAVAGPVRNGGGALTNLAWQFDESGLARECAIGSVFILNDLQAQGYGLATLRPGASACLMSGRGTPDPLQTQLVVGVGTGFNATTVYHHRGGRLVTPSECGHATLPQATQDHRQLAAFLEQTHGFASVEDVLSGRGLSALYSWDKLGPAERKDAKTIMAAAEAGNDPRARETLRIFVQLLAVVTGDLALATLPFGGIYLIGGMARAVVPWFEWFEFETTFKSKGRFSALMDEFSVHVITDDFAALDGCASFLSERAEFG